MSSLADFCTCKDLDCPLHPSNHDKGCSLCIAKNLRLGEIPNCFFNLVDKEHKAENYKFEDFAKIVLDSEK